MIGGKKYRLNLTLEHLDELPVGNKELKQTQSFLQQLKDSSVEIIAVVNTDQSLKFCRTDFSVISRLHSRTDYGGTDNRIVFV